MRPDLPKLRELVTALRAPMPEGFIWDMETYYFRTNSRFAAGCAWALAYHIGLVPTAIPVAGYRYCFGLTGAQISRLFAPGGDDLAAEGIDARLWRDLTPTMQADRIEKFIRELEPVAFVQPAREPELVA